MSPKSGQMAHRHGKRRECTQGKALARAMGTGAELERRLQCGPALFPRVHQAFPRPKAPEFRGAEAVGLSNILQPQAFPRVHLIKSEAQERMGHKPWVLPGWDPVEAMCPKEQGSKWWPARLGAFANGNGSRHLWG